MAEYLEREAVVKYLLSWKRDFLDDYGKGWSAGIGAASGICSNFPAADVAPVVRCKQCVQGEDASKEMYAALYRCRSSGILHKTDHYCGYGRIKMEVEEDD